MFPVVQQGGITHLHPTLCFTQVLQTTPRDISIQVLLLASIYTLSYTFKNYTSVQNPQASKFRFILCKFEIVVLP